jgi:DNA-directed RNA polymerase subunit RPC12/RpoP
MTVKTHQPEQVITCPHCDYAVTAEVRSLQRRPLRRCPRCGRGHVPAAQSAHVVDAETLEDVRELLDQLLAIPHGSPDAAEVIRQLEELIDVATGPTEEHNHTP